MAHVSVFFIVKNGILSILFVPLPCQFTLTRKCRFRLLKLQERNLWLFTNNMVIGTTTFKCDECGNKFKALATEWCATCYIAPMRCPKCGTMHTYPVGINNLGGILGPDSVYRKIWKSQDSK